MRYFNPSKFLLLVLFQLTIPRLYGQVLPLQTFSLAAESFVSNQVDGLQIDWRLDLGLTAMPLRQSNAYYFSAGFLQPTINRFANEGLWEKYNPSIELKNTLRRDGIVLFSKEPDLILFGYNIFDLHGQVIKNDQTKYKSSYAGRAIQINGMASGVYIMQVMYLPEWMTFDHKNNYWTKTIKFILP